LDFLGINYYNPVLVGLRDESDDLRSGERRVAAHPGVVTISLPEQPVTAMGWPVDAEGLYDLLLQVRDRVPQLPLYITENGMAAHDYVDPNGEVVDDERVDYLHGHLDAAARAIDAGVDLRGYFCWSFLDNFEWAEGYSKRFGLVFIDYGTQRRIPKQSAAFYSQVAHSNVLPAG
jgi:beta-glucosidase